MLAPPHTSWPLLQAAALAWAVWCRAGLRVAAGRPPSAPAEAWTPREPSSTRSVPSKVRSRGSARGGGSVHTVTSTRGRRLPGSCQGARPPEQPWGVLGYSLAGILAPASKRLRRERRSVLGGWGAAPATAVQPCSEYRGRGGLRGWGRGESSAFPGSRRQPLPSPPGSTCSQAWKGGRWSRGAGGLARGESTLRLFVPACGCWGLPKGPN